MNHPFKLLFIAFLCLASYLNGQADSPAFLQIPELTVAPDRSDWTYEVGEPVAFTISLHAHGNPLSDVEVSYQVGPELHEGPAQSAIIRDGRFSFEANPLQKPGFLRCIATVTLDGEQYTARGTAAFSPERIRPTQVEPADFDSYWSDQLESLEKIDLRPVKTPYPKLNTPEVNTFKVRYQSWGKQNGEAPFYGVLTEPNKEGKFPAVLQVPGAGVRPYTGNHQLAKAGFIAFQIGIHSIPIDLEGDVYSNLRYAGLHNYWGYNLNDRDEYYFRRVFLGCVKALDILTTHPNWDGETLIVYGGSQGGFLSIVTSALDKRVTGLVANYPAYCDVTGTLHDRAGGWPKMFRYDRYRQENMIATTAYYDGVNFAKRLTVPGSYAFGYNDTVCPPTSMYSAYNVITAPKDLTIQVDMPHSPSSSFRDETFQRVLRIAGMELETQSSR
ncbi:acetylxylan esterase [Pelagicoccus sp. SDUM812002]|uniref:acetylxylan esterase n=1 Tax=Pelagicoccus sp. SDUM812002 TaxID=3041266 RepID=UPI00280F74EF|nr:acetylxylan esterase [Pelagicoccus sp. SDUM812002]MDQ8187718.1 acetylxylan esterase [Pelagicoccus sp. SDUM812002]